MDAASPVTDERIEVEQSRPANSQQEWKGGFNLAGENWMSRRSEPVSEEFQELLRQKREIDGDDEIVVDSRREQCGLDAADRPEPRSQIRNVLTADGLNRIANGCEQPGHVFEERAAVPMQQGFVAAHSEAAAPCEHETVDGRWR